VQCLGYQFLLHYSTKRFAFSGKHHFLPWKSATRASNAADLFRLCPDLRSVGVAGLEVDEMLTADDD
jgi:hypothetical protein